MRVASLRLLCLGAPDLPLLRRSLAEKVRRFAKFEVAQLLPCDKRRVIGTSLGTNLTINLDQMTVPTPSQKCTKIKVGSNASDPYLGKTGQKI